MQYCCCCRFVASAVAVAIAVAMRRDSVLSAVGVGVVYGVVLQYAWKCAHSLHRLNVPLSNFTAVGTILHRRLTFEME